MSDITLEVHTLTSELSRLGSNLQPATNSHPGLSQAVHGREAGRPVYQHQLVDVKDPMVSFLKSRWAIVGTLPWTYMKDQGPSESILPETLLSQVCGTFGS